MLECVRLKLKKKVKDSNLTGEEKPKSCEQFLTLFFEEFSTKDHQNTIAKLYLSRQKKGEKLKSYFIRYYKYLMKHETAVKREVANQKLNQNQTKTNTYFTMVQWTPKKQSRVLGLIQGDRHSLSKITKITNIPKQTLEDRKKCNTPWSKPQLSCPSKLSDHHKCRIIFHITRNYQSLRLSALSIIRDLQLQAHLNILIQTLKSLSYNYRIFQHWPFFKKLDYKRRLQFAKRYAHLSVDDWKVSIWTDEMSVKIGMEWTTQDWIWRKADEEFHSDYINYTKWAMGTGMMFWGSFRWGKMGPGVFLIRKMRGQSIQ